MDNNKYLELFVEESKEHIQILNKNLLELEVDPQNIGSINEIFRAAHTLKGMAGTLELSAITDIAHGMENILDEIRSKKKEITCDLIDILFECTDTLERLIQDVIEQGNEGTRDVMGLLSKLDGLTSSSDKEINRNKYNVADLDQYQLSIVDIGRQQGLVPYWVDIQLQPTCLLKAARAYIVFQTLESFGEIIKSIPPVQDIEEERFEDKFSVLILSASNEKNIKSNLELILEIQSVEISRLQHNIDTKDKNIASTPSITTIKRDKADWSDNQILGVGNNLGQPRNIRVDIEKLDHLMNLVSELLTVKNTMVDFIKNDENLGIIEPIEYLAGITNELHGAVMDVRMVPIEMVFNRFPRVVRNLAKNTGKKVSLNIVGSETEIDRTIIEEIGDPLIHLIRNAIDHGIEIPEERIQMGKEPTGEIDLIAHHHGNNVVIEIRDDGHGINPKHLAKIALDKGLLTEVAMDSLEDKDIINLLFHPGFSTAESVSDISGRGVGMDVVKTKVESLGGTIDIDTQLYKGSRFTIHLPLTLSIIQALLVEIMGETFVVPLNSIKEIIDIPISEISRIRGQEVIPYGDVLVPLIRLEEALEMKKENQLSEQMLTVIIINKGKKQSAMAVGNLIGQQEIVIKPLGNFLSNIKIISGATILGNGKVALILNINHLV